MVTAPPIGTHHVELRLEPLSEARWEVQRQRGLYVVERGEPFAIPVDRLHDPSTFLDRRFWAHDAKYGTHRPGVRFDAPLAPRRVGGGLRLQGTLFGLHWHAGWADPFDPELVAEPPDPSFQTAPRHPGHIARRWVACERHVERISRDCRRCKALSEPLENLRLRAAILNAGRFGGFVENLGLLSVMKVTDAFVSEQVDELFVTTSTEFADFDFHEVGTNAQVENNNDTALIGTSGIARATGTPVDEDPDYANDATITADATETWEEWGLFNNASSVALMDRALTGGQAVNSSDQVTYQFTLTLSPEA